LRIMKNIESFLILLEILRMEDDFRPQARSIPVWECYLIFGNEYAILFVH
jgi:hypothetical protein